MKTCFTLARHNSSAKSPQGQLVFDVLCFTEGKMFNLHFCVRDMVLEILILWTCKTFIFSKTGSVWRKWPLKWAVLYFFWCQKNTPWNILEHFFWDLILLHEKRIYDSVLIRENTDHRNPVIWHILRSGMQQLFACKYYFTVNKCKKQ